MYNPLMIKDIRVLNIDSKEERVETGPMKFGGDWAGIFIRGDDAFAYSYWLKIYKDNPSSEFAERYLDHVIELLESCNEGNTGE